MYELISEFLKVSTLLCEETARLSLGGGSSSDYGVFTILVPDLSFPVGLDPLQMSNDNMERDSISMTLEMLSRSRRDIPV
jgi:hypothetical protein